MTQWYFIQPHDVWMFRGAKPFTAGQGFVARSEFPPTPQTMQGIIRSHILELSGVDWDAYAQRRDESLLDIIGAPATRNAPATLGRFDISGPFVAQRRKDNSISRLIRVPADVLKHKERDHYQVLSPQSAEFYSNAPAGWLPLGGASPDHEEAMGWLDDEQFAHYLQNQQVTQVITQDNLFQHDARIGLGLNAARRAAEESLLYHVEFVRPVENVGLLVGVHDDLAERLGEYGVMSTGGESRSSTYEYVEYRPSQPSTTLGNFKVVLLTPAYFEGGWQPGSGDWSPWIGTGRLVSVALGRPQLISGWDIANNRAKPLYHYIPPGSVFFFENATPPAQPFTETPAGELDYARLGFGAFATGIWS